jgi:hypothetical protein
VSRAVTLFSALKASSCSSRSPAGSMINDVILFGKELAERLQGHARAAKRNYGRGAPKVAEVNLSKLDSLGLPDRKEYEAVLTALRGEAVGSEPGAGTSGADQCVP